jgi:nicotinate phosphoribosyltransferase
MEGDTLAVEGEDQPGESLIEPVMRNGRRLRSSPSLAEIRGRAARDLARLPRPLRRLETGQPYPVVVAEGLVRLAAEADQRLKTKEP